MTTTTIHHNSNRNSHHSKTALVRSNSSRKGGSLFGTIDKTISRTFSLSSSEGDDDPSVPNDAPEGFSDEGTHWTASPPRIPDLRLPLERTHVPRKASGFFMESMIRRDSTKTKYILYHQSTTEAVPMFCAEKYPPSDGGQILIKSVDEGNNDATASPTILGSLMKTKKKKHQQQHSSQVPKHGGITTTTYQLILHEADKTHKSTTTPLVVETIDYEQVGRARYFLEGGRPRCARVTLLGTSNGLDCAETKEPSTSSSGQKVLDFGGRGRETSSKNTQLVRSSNGSAESDCDCCLQMVKWRDNEFNLDFGPPFDAFRAFAFALAQFDF